MMSQARKTLRRQVKQWPEHTPQPASSRQSKTIQDFFDNEPPELIDLRKLVRRSHVRPLGLTFFRAT
jgi:hypothetical protein